MGSGLVGSTLGRFRVDRLIGRGGMGAVYAAFDERLERDVALKVLNEDGDLTVQKKRLLREARIAAKLTHPNIATVFEVDELDGRLYIVMELLEGCALRKIVSSRKVGVDEGITIARDIARALARAHMGGVIHRDIKPENVFVTTPSPDVMLTKVLDFGLARQRPVAGAVAEPTFTASRGDLWGTPGYVSPEQAHGDKVNLRTDIFSFGVVVYEMLAGIKPFRGDNPIAVLVATTRYEERPIREIAPEIPIEIADIIHRCLRKDREERFADGMALSAALETFVRGQPSSRSSTSLVGSSPREPIVELEDVGGERVASGALDANHSRTIGGAAPIPPPVSDGAHQRERRDHVKIAIAVGSGVVLAFILTLVTLAWTTSSPQARASTSSDPASAPLAAAHSSPPPATAAAEPPPIVAPTPTAAADPAPEGTADPAGAATPAPPAVAEPAPHVGPTRPAPAASSRPAGPRRKPADCVDPFKVDSKGVKIPKLHCL